MIFMCLQEYFTSFEWVFFQCWNSIMDRSFAVDAWLLLFVWAQCVFVSMLQSFSPVSRMFNYLLCHVSAAWPRFFTPFWLLFFSLTVFPSSGLKSAWPPFTFFSPHVLILRLCNSVFLESNWQALQLQTLLKMQPGAVVQLTSAEQVKLRHQLTKSKVSEKVIPRIPPLVLAAPSLLSAPAPAAFTTSSLAAGTPFVSRFCTPNTHTPDLLP